MQRIIATSYADKYDDQPSYRWFDADKATRFDENVRWDGHSQISCATGSQWDHETLFRTAGGKWIKSHQSAYRGSLYTFAEITSADAAEWLLQNGHRPTRPRMFGEKES